MTPQTNLEDDAPPEISDALVGQLDKIASAHGGQVPLHGRLFAQWLHYVFPQQCPFPHKTGDASTARPHEFTGGDFIASKAEMTRHAERAKDASLPGEMGKEDFEWMSQWSQ